ncbi:tRNA (adenosine(37)-N6)-dimethylallyltransferase MiaA [Flavobacterium sp. N1719]|uniref:tRNA (adenosine(37)-N6)-dimethylallyltransferase MiaA n=1 Tax=Flavobacterium sp. N1719 TaxID=2885633 RepID=UPI002221B49D|nr:tRNA (adenosine(37)-N6)-dimethylallyltransferase MiaA [Flavobacterium sp. N1719]
MQNQPVLITVIGPTAIGKTALAIRLANHFNCSIISCDSRQFFKEMTIGTAVPSPEELAAAPHYFIQNISIYNAYSVGDFETEALAQLDQLFQENPVQIMVGGSGLYVDAVRKGLDNFPDIDPSIRESINARYAIDGLPYLQATLHELDPQYYQKILLENPQTLQNPQRMKRFVEVCLGTGQPYSSFLGKKETNRPFRSIIIGLEAEREELNQRINHRVDLMMAAGLLKEVSDLYPYRSYNALQTVGYRELFDFLDQKCSLEEAIENIKMNTRRFAKRQMTWFKRTPEVHWFNYSTDFATLLEQLHLRLK